MVLLLAACTSSYDDSAIKARLDAIETKLIELEANIQSLQSAIGEGVFVAKVQEYKDPETGKTIGVTVTYTTGEVKYFEISPKAEYTAPVLGVIKNGAGDLVWAIDGIAIKIDGNEIPVYQTPVFTIDGDGNLLVSIDGSDPVILGQVQNEGATLVDGIFTDIKVEQDKIVLTLSDNSVVNIPFAEAFKLNIETTEFVFTSLDPISIPYTVSAKTSGTVVGVAGYNPKQFSVKVEADKIVVTPVTMKSSAVLLAYADSKVGLTSMVSIAVEAEGVELLDTPYSGTVDYVAEGEDAVVEANVVSNVEFDVKPQVDWITVVSVKAKAYVITLALANNDTGELREGTVNLTKKGTDTVIQTITIAQDKVVAGPKDLGKKETANCYIVSSAGEYMFKAVKGNTEESVGAVASAALLWETCNNTEDVAANSVIASVGVEGGYITFATPATLKPGNALIAAKDSEGKILWSWHIWIPETEIAEGTYGFSSTYKMMDRNLGALHVAEAGAVDAAACGMYYQWGRKDPFKPLGDLANKTVATTAPADVWSTVSAQFTVQQAIEQPTVFAFGSNDWCSEPDDNLWTDASKTQYDPCPVGYKVPAYGDPKLFDYVTAANYDAWAWNADSVTAGTVEAGTTILPYNGLIYYSSGNYDGVAARVRMWTSTQKGAGAARALDLKSSDQSTSGTGQKRASGNGIRCVTVAAE